PSKNLWLTPAVKGRRLPASGRGQHGAWRQHSIDRASGYDVGAIANLHRFRTTSSQNPGKAASGVRVKRTPRALNGLGQAILAAPRDGRVRRAFPFRALALRASERPSPQFRIAPALAPVACARTPPSPRAVRRYG